MGFPVIKGVIDRRILINYTVDPGALQKILLLPSGQNYTKTKLLQVFA
jgi:hypothetical protein